MNISKDDFKKTLEIMEKAQELAYDLCKIKYGSRDEYINEMEIYDDYIYFSFEEYYCGGRDHVGSINITFEDLQDKEGAIKRLKEQIAEEKEQERIAAEERKAKAEQQKLEAERKKYEELKAKFEA